MRQSQSHQPKEALPHPALSAGTLPKPEIAWREFRLTPANGRARVFAIAIEPDGKSFRYREGELGGNLRESRTVTVEGSGAEDPIQACALEVERRILLRLSKGYGEYIDGKLVQSKALGIDFSQLLSKNVKTPKPEQVISDGEFRRLHKAGLARITRKYDGVGLMVVHHDHGWEIYTLNGNRVTARFPHHVEALKHTGFGPGTFLKGEGVVFDAKDPLKENFELANKTFAPARKAKVIREQIETGELKEPSFVFYDILYVNGEALSHTSYDDRAKLWRTLPVARGGSGLLLSAEFFPQMTPDNWQTIRKQLGYEGFVVVDASSSLGKKAITFGQAPPRPKGSYKLKPNAEEDVVAYAVRKVDGLYESIFIKQRYPACFPGTNIPHPKAGEWFYSGRVSTHQMKDVIAGIDRLVRAGKIQVVSNNKEGEAIDINNANGVTVVIEYFQRFPTNRFRHAKFMQPARFRDQDGDTKEPEECIAHCLGEIPPKKTLSTSARPPRTMRPHDLQSQRP